MKFNKLILATSLSLVSINVLAENYQSEVDVTYINTDSSNGFAANIKYHFDEVDTSNKPLQEAEFLDRSSNVSLGYNDINEDVNINAEFYLNSFYIAPSYTNPDNGDSFFAATVGYVGNDWRITTTIPEEDYELNIDFKYVRALSGDDFINIEAGFADGGDNNDDTVFISSDYYFDKTFSVGAVITNTDDTDFGLRINKFFTSKFSAGASFTATDNDDIFAISAAMRF